MDDVASVDSQSVASLPKISASTAISSAPVSRPVVLSATAVTIAPAPAASALPANRMDRVSRPPASAHTPATPTLSHTVTVTAPASMSVPVPPLSTTSSPLGSVSTMTATVTAKFAEIVALSQQLAASHTVANGAVTGKPQEVNQSRDTQSQPTATRHSALGDKVTSTHKAGAANTLTTAATTTTVRPASAPAVPKVASKTVMSAHRAGGAAVAGKTATASAQTKAPLVPRVGWVAPQGSTPAAKASPVDTSHGGSDGGPNTTLSSLNESSYCEESSYTDSSFSSDNQEDSVVANNLRQLQEFKSLLGALPDRLAAALATSAPPVSAIQAPICGPTAVPATSTKSWAMSVPNEPPLRRAPVMVH
jgi:hypothetical protein